MLDGLVLVQDQRGTACYDTITGEQHTIVSWRSRPPPGCAISSSGNLLAAFKDSDPYNGDPKDSINLVLYSVSMSKDRRGAIKEIQSTTMQPTNKQAYVVAFNPKATVLATTQHQTGKIEVRFAVAR